MSTPNQTAWTTDFAQLQADATAYNNAQTAAENAATALKTALNSYHKGPLGLPNIYYVIALIYASISPGLEASETPYGAAEKIAADIQRCNNDLHNMTNDNSSSTTSVSNAYTDSEDMVNFLNGQSGNTAATYVSEALGSTTTQSLITNFQAINGIFFTGSGTPPPNTIWDGTGQAPTGAITTFAQLQQDMAQPGDPSGANNIYHTILNASNTNSSTLSTQTNVANTSLKMLSSEDKQWMSFGNDMIQMFEGIMKAAQQHAQNANG